MTLTDYGLNYCLKSFGDANGCAVSTAYGLTFSYVDTKNISYSNIAGGTASILNFLALGIVKTLTMDQFPGRGTFTKTLVETENRASISFGDGDIFTQHDELSGDQWCFISCSAHPNKAICEDVYRCFWWNNSCHDVAPTRGDLNNPGDCQRYFPGSYWYDDGTGVYCHPTLICENINNMTECVGHGCFWYNGSCHSTIVCGNIFTRTECEAHGCLWWNNACHSVAPACTVLNNDSDCLRYGCKWYRGNTYPTYTCHVADQPGLCHWTDATTGGPYGVSSLDVFILVTAYTDNTKVPGYNFIPTSLEIFGVVLYYQDPGHMANGNAYTGCAYP